MKAEIIATGTEILLGQTLNTSAHYITGKLSELGIEVDFHTTVGDNQDRVEAVLKQALNRSDLVLTTGGTGPTVDDMTKELVAKVLGLKMQLDKDSLERVQHFFSSRGSAMPKTEEKEVYFPEGSQILTNDHGTAPGAILQSQGKTVVILPGPPSEMKPMFDHDVFPFLEKLVFSGSGRMYSRVIKSFGWGESKIEQALQDLMGNDQLGMSLLAKSSEMHIRLVVRSDDEQHALEVLDKNERIIRERLGAGVFGKDDETMLGIVNSILLSRGLTIATAESCTGGLLGASLSQEPGSSETYLGGVVSYSNSLKEGFLGVKSQTLQTYGAVSPETAREMAAGVKERSGADLAVGITGIAGPGGGSNEKPVGLVYIGLATPEGVQANKFQFQGQRESVRQLSVMAALDLVRQYLLKVERSTL
ncbi:competence/damage-inducible protein A [Desulfitobacterium sp. Sab5]|uniref:competence/damage-inducible protein A n=1 Tax=Desulfitobacterium nosdiversum TaxID=3375356 RepID=UPI003CF2F7E6